MKALNLIPNHFQKFLNYLECDNYFIAYLLINYIKTLQKIEI